MNAPKCQHCGDPASIKPDLTWHRVGSDLCCKKCYEMLTAVEEGVDFVAFLNIKQGARHIKGKQPPAQAAGP